MNRVEVWVLAEAVQDLENGAEYYEARQPGVGDDFWDSLLADIGTLEFSSGVHTRQLGCHRKIATRFPYAIFYRTQTGRAEVIAVLPMRRDPKWIGRQLRSRR
jgi:plasmid stabilization system protein ParE